MDKPFASDGCSVIQPVYEFFGATPPAAAFCRLHDVDYWAGGPLRDYVRANREVRQRTSAAGYPVLAWIRWLGVTLGGWPFLPTPWRWGFGWHFGRWRLFRALEQADRTRRDAEMARELAAMTDAERAIVAAAGRGGTP
jgi:hypothetical protein